MEKFYFIDIKIICASKYTIKKMKEQTPIWERIFAIHISDKGLVSKNSEDKVVGKNGQKTWTL